MMGKSVFLIFFTFLNLYSEIIKHTTNKGSTLLSISNKDYRNVRKGMRLCTANSDRKNPELIIDGDLIEIYNGDLLILWK